MIMRLISFYIGYAAEKVRAAAAAAAQTQPEPAQEISVDPETFPHSPPKGAYPTPPRRAAPKENSAVYGEQGSEQQE